MAFLDLPTEVRTRIYECLFDRALVHNGTQDQELNAHCPSAILFTCRACYTEARSIYYKRAIFVLNSRALGALLPARNTDSELTAGTDMVRYLRYASEKMPRLWKPLNIFPNLKRVEIVLPSDFFPYDFTNADKAIRYLRRSGGSAVLQHGFRYMSSKDRGALAYWSLYGARRGFKVMLFWKMQYRFIDFDTELDLDSWILKLWNADGDGQKHWEIDQSRTKQHIEAFAGPDNITWRLLPAET